MMHTAVPDYATDSIMQPAEPPTWQAAMSQYRRPSFWRASWQIASSLGVYLLVWCAIYFSLGVSWWLTVPLAILAGGLLVRTFVIFHDCSHGSFYRSKRANTFWGFVCSLLAFTPYYRWRWQHALHHAGSGNLDRRGPGDLWTLTVQEYLDASNWKRFWYRLTRNPLVLFTIGPLVQMLIMERLPQANSRKRERHSVWWTNLAILVMVAAMGFIFGWFNYLLIQLIILLVAGSAGLWLFYVQHQFENTYWARSDNWDYMEAALQGSSYYQLPRVLQWFSANIGFHHIHHLNPSIPNYHLEKCHHSHPMFRRAPTLTLKSSLKSMGYRVWDESGQRLIGLGQLRRERRAG